MHTNPEVLALLALGETAGTPAERGHVRSCPVCSEEVADLARIADVGRTSTLSEPLASPGPQVWERIQTELGFDLPGSVITQGDAADGDRLPSATVTDLVTRRDLESDDATPGRAGGRRYVALVAAAALALVVGVGIGILYERQVLKPENRVIARADLKAFPQFPGATGTVEVTADGRGHRKLLLRMTSPEPIKGQAEVWLMASGDDTHPTAMGVMADGKADIDIPPGMSLFQQPVVDISEEPVGDTDTVHSGVSILRGPLV